MKLYLAARKAKRHIRCISSVRPLPQNYLSEPINSASSYPIPQMQPPQEPSLIWNWNQLFSRIYPRCPRDLNKHGSERLLAGNCIEIQFHLLANAFHHAISERADIHVHMYLGTRNRPVVLPVRIHVGHSGDAQRIGPV